MRHAGAPARHLGWRVPRFGHVCECSSDRAVGDPGVIFSADETTDIGNETGTTVSPDDIAHISKFTGTINWVHIDLGDDAKDADHYIDPDERFRVAMARH